MTLDEWIIYGNVGISSKTIWAALKGIDIDSKFGDKPYDPGDFGRCYKLVENCEVKDLSIIVEKLPYWKPYIDNWDKLCKMYERSISNDWNLFYYNDMYYFMQKLHKESEKILSNKF